MGTGIKMQRGKVGDDGVQVMMMMSKQWQEKQLQRTETRTGIKQIKEQETIMFDGYMDGVFA